MTDTPTPQSGPDNPLIIALDGLDVSRAEALIRLLTPHVWGFKFNDALHDRELDTLYAAAGDEARLFIDCKLHDIPNTVANTIRRICARRIPQLITVHASGGPAMMSAAVRAADEASNGRTAVLAVTVLTSLDDETCRAVYGALPPGQVSTLAQIAALSGCHGMVCSPHELNIARRVGLRAVVPGIRPAWYQDHDGNGHRGDDQSRVATARSAMADGATSLVIGRPIVHAPDPLHAVQRTLDEIRHAVQSEPRN
ncbi:MAG: orotidine-5'-phosphate decarboxylase [Planctomycetota bacterium]